VDWTAGIGGLVFRRVVAGCEVNFMTVLEEVSGYDVFKEGGVFRFDGMNDAL